MQCNDMYAVLKEYLQNHIHKMKIENKLWIEKSKETSVQSEDTCISVIYPKEKVVSSWEMSIKKIMIWIRKKKNGKRRE